MLLLMCHVPLVAQSPQLFTSSEGLSCSQIESLMQDSKGYIWISTSYGLSRFDGVQFDTFYHDDNDSLSLAGNKVVSVIEDNQGKIWVATTTNLQWYDSGNFDFRKIKFESFDAVQASSLSISGIAFAKDEDNKESLLELLNFQIEELEKADIKVGEREELTKKRALIQKSEDIIKSLNLAISVINGDDENIGIEQACADVSRTLFKFDETKDVYDVFNDINDKLELAKDKAEALLLSIDFSPEEIEMIDEKLDLYYKFSNKYGQTEQEMLDYLEKAKEKRNSILFADEELNRLNEEYENLLNITVKLADKLSVERKKTAKVFEENVKQELAFLDMPKMQFYVDFNKGNLSSTGYDKIEFLISANPGEPPKSLSKVASGGELSRIMLAIKNIISYNDTIGTLIFDEIDTGVSGRASQKIGLKLKSVSKNTQVICVTHSAQIASNADEHFLIQKKFNDNKTFTCVTPLDFEGRKQELARIMGGLEITDTLLQSAEELLNQNLCSD